MRYSPASKTSFFVRVRYASALTLVEVLTGLAIIAFVSSSVMVARAKLARQTVKAHQKLQACEIMDEILSENFYSSWSAVDAESVAVAETETEAEIKQTDSGTINTDNGQWKWQMQRKTAALTEPVIADVLEIKLFAPDGKEGEPVLQLALPVAQPVEDENEENPEPDTTS